MSDERIFIEGPENGSTIAEILDRLNRLCSLPTDRDPDGSTILPVLKNGEDPIKVVLANTVDRLLTIVEKSVPWVDDSPPTSSVFGIDGPKGSSIIRHCNGCGAITPSEDLFFVASEQGWLCESCRSNILDAAAHIEEIGTCDVCGGHVASADLTSFDGGESEMCPKCVLEYEHSELPLPQAVGKMLLAKLPEGERLAAGGPHWNPHLAAIAWLTEIDQSSVASDQSSVPAAAEPYDDDSSRPPVRGRVIGWSVDGLGTVFPTPSDGNSYMIAEVPRGSASDVHGDIEISCIPEVGQPAEDAGLTERDVAYAIGRAMSASVPEGQTLSGDGPCFENVSCGRDAICWSLSPQPTATEDAPPDGPFEPGEIVECEPGENPRVARLRDLSTATIVADSRGVNWTRVRDYIGMSGLISTVSRTFASIDDIAAEHPELIADGAGQVIWGPEIIT